MPDRHRAGYHRDRQQAIHYANRRARLRDPEAWQRDFDRKWAELQPRPVVDGGE